ncbi:hypothetical protein, partial [Silvimonas terrae]|uniref:hypothetical protein n=1 Tax=Silvimonas terrae TaxID=300266 RepID=UPI001C86307C
NSFVFAVSLLCLQRRNRTIRTIPGPVNTFLQYFLLYRNKPLFPKQSFVTKRFRSRFEPHFFPLLSGFLHQRGSFALLWPGLAHSWRYISI